MPHMWLAQRKLLKMASGCSISLYAMTTRLSPSKPLALRPKIAGSDRGRLKGHGAERDGASASYFE